ETCTVSRGTNQSHCPSVDFGGRTHDTHAVSPRDGTYVCPSCALVFAHSGHEPSGGPSPCSSGAVRTSGMSRDGGGQVGRLSALRQRRDRWVRKVWLRGASTPGA